MTCRDCLHYESHKHFFNSPNYKKDFDDYFKDKDIEHKCPEFTDRSEWVYLPDEEYTFTIRGDVAKGIIIANCRAAEKTLEEKK